MEKIEKKNIIDQVNIHNDKTYRWAGIVKMADEFYIVIRYRNEELPDLVVKKNNYRDACCAFECFWRSF